MRRKQYKTTKKTMKTTFEGFFTNGEPSGEWKVVYNKKTYKGSLEELKKQVTKLNEFSF